MVVLLRACGLIHLACCSSVASCRTPQPCPATCNTAGRYLGPCGLRSTSHECCRNTVALFMGMLQGMRKIDPHRHAARQGHRAGLNLTCEHLAKRSRALLGLWIEKSTKRHECCRTVVPLMRSSTDPHAARHNPASPPRPTLPASVCRKPVSEMPYYCSIIYGGRSCSRACARLIHTGMLLAKGIVASTCACEIP
jgi:hypothetical protein